jgi:hypothetical protein
MSETQPTTQDEAGITRNEDGSIAPPKVVETKPEVDSTKPETKTEDTSISKDDKSLLTKDDKKNELVGVPEKYEPFKVPEGYEIPEEMNTQISEMFKKHGLTQTAGQELVDFYTKNVTEAADGPVKLWQDMQTQWRDENIKGPLGNGKDDLKPEVKANVAKVINSLPADMQGPFKEAMDLTGAGNNPAFVRALNALAQFVTEGKPVGEGKPVAEANKRPGAPSGPSASAMYPHLAQRG